MEQPSRPKKAKHTGPPRPRPDPYDEETLVVVLIAFFCPALAVYLRFGCGWWVPAMLIFTILTLGIGGILVAIYLACKSDRKRRARRGEYAAEPRRSTGRTIAIAQPPEAPLPTAPVSAGVSTQTLAPMSATTSRVPTPPVRTPTPAILPPVPRAPTSTPTDGKSPINNMPDLAPLVLAKEELRRPSRASTTASFISPPLATTPEAAATGVENRSPSRAPTVTIAPGPHTADSDLKPPSRAPTMTPALEELPPPPSSRQATMGPGGGNTDVRPPSRAPTAASATAPQDSPPPPSSSRQPTMNPSSGTDLKPPSRAPTASTPTSLDDSPPLRASRQPTAAQLGGTDGTSSEYSSASAGSELDFFRPSSPPLVRVGSPASVMGIKSPLSTRSTSRLE